MKSIRVGLIQPQVKANNAENFKHVESLIELAASEDARVLCLPERWYFVDPFKTSFPDCIQEQFGQQYQYVRQWAKEYNVGIVSGGIWEWHADPGQGRPYISTYYFNSQGQDLGRQDKIHLYGLEKEGFTPGNAVSVFHDVALNFKFALFICFDLNISSTLAKIAVRHGAEFIFSPTLIRKTGLENWKIYIQARALETRTPLLSCNSIFNYLKRNFEGESKIIHFQPGSPSPMKLITDEMNDRPGYLVREINLDFPNSVRQARLDENVSADAIEIKYFPE